MTRAPAGTIHSFHGIEMYCERIGQGPPLLLLHGFCGAGGDWSGLAELWAADHELIVPDLRGHGRSTNPSGAYTHRQAALDVFALLDRLGIAEIQAIGVSGGGNALLHMATHQPERVRAMVLVSAASYYAGPARAFMRQFTIESRTAADWQRMRQRHHHGDEQILTLWTLARGFASDTTDMSFTPPLLATITARTLLINGDRDPLVPVAQALEMHAAIPRSYLWIVPNGGHGPITGETKAHFLDTANAFLRGEWEAG